MQIKAGLFAIAKAKIDHKDVHNLHTECKNQVDVKNLSKIAKIYQKYPNLGGL